MGIIKNARQLNADANAEEVMLLMQEHAEEGMLLIYSVG
jgi:hypothetical protein